MLNGIRYDTLDTITLYTGQNVCLNLWEGWGEFTTLRLTSFSICLPLDVVFLKALTQMQEGIKDWTLNQGPAVWLGLDKWPMDFLGKR